MANSSRFKLLISVCTCAPFKRGLRRLRADQGGAAIILTAFLLPILIGVVGIAVDVGMWESNKRDLQGAADQAAYSAARAASQTGATYAQSVMQAKAVMASMGFTDGVGGVTIAVSNPPTSGNYTGNSRAWEVRAQKTQVLYFSSLFLTNAPAIGVRAVALKQTYQTTNSVNSSTTTNTKPGCILTLDSSGHGATTVTNNGAVPTTSCAIYTNSSASDALKCYNNCNITADTFTVGGFFKGSGSATMSGANKTGQKATVNPYSGLAAPSTSGMSCLNPGGAIAATSAASRTISPGYYCKGINFSGASKTLIMSAGTYYIDSIFMVGNGATLNATAGVTIVIVGSFCIGDTNNTCQHPDEGIGNTANLNITAPTTGPYAGVAMYFANSTARTQPFANNAHINVQGVLYAPYQKLQFNNNSYFDNTKCTQLVAFQVDIENNGNFGTNCGGTGVKPITNTETTTTTTTTTTGTDAPSSMVE